MDKKTDKAFDISKKLVDKISKYKYPLAIVLVGLALLSFPISSSNKSPPKSEDSQTSIESFDLQALEKRLSEMLSKCEGVGKSEVLLTQSGSSEKVYEKNSELNISRKDESEDQTYEKQEQSELALTQNGSYVQTPVIIKYNYPKITGALVICEGGSNDRVRLDVIHAVSAVTGLSSDSISIIKMKTI